MLSFALTAGLSSRLDAKILLRIDDLDSRRVRQSYIRDIFDTLNFLEIPWHEGPADPEQFRREYSQVRRLDLYRDALDRLRKGRHVFACTCSRSDVLQKSEDGNYPGTCRDRIIPYESKNVSWRLRTIPGETLRVNCPGNELINAELPGPMRDFIVRRKDGLPSYQLASLIDDLHFGVNLVIRGEDLWNSTLAQLYLAGVLGQASFGRNIFYHHKLLLDPGGRKLSKSTAAGRPGEANTAAAGPGGASTAAPGTSGANTAARVGPASAVSVRHLRKQGKKRAEVYALIGNMLHLGKPVSDWQSLAAAVGEKRI